MFEDSQSATQVLSALTYNTLSAIRSESGVAVNKIEQIGPDTPFYIDVRGAVYLSANTSLQKSTDGKTWENIISGGDLPEGKTYFRVANDQSKPLKPGLTEYSNSDYDIGGNINSLVKKNFENDTTCYSFLVSSKTGFFDGKTKLKSAKNLILPANSLTVRCYRFMFQGCTSLTQAPKLPAMNLQSGCYDHMFANCTSLTTAPELPATTLISECYMSMFNSCASLTTAPELPATELASSCYSSMFQRCTALTTAPELPVTTLAAQCYYCMFLGCTSLTTAPELPATTLAGSCYGGMFSGCTSLNYIKCLATDISASSCLDGWVSDVPSTGTFVKDSNMEGWTTGIAGIPEGWTVEDAA